MHLSSLRHPLTRLNSIINKKCISNKSESYDLIYSCQYGKIGSVVNRIKFQQTVLTAIALPSTYALQTFNIVPSDIFLACSIIGLSTNVVFYGVGQLLYKLIGKAYISTDHTILKLSFAGFFGKRIDCLVPIEHVRLSENPGKLYTKLQAENLNLKIQEKHYEYCNMELSRKAFGESFSRL